MHPFTLWINPIAPSHIAPHGVIESYAVALRSSVSFCNNGATITRLAGPHIGQTFRLNMREFLTSNWAMFRPITNFEI